MLFALVMYYVPDGSFVQSEITEDAVISCFEEDQLLKTQKVNDRFVLFLQPKS